MNYITGALLTISGFMLLVFYAIGLVIGGYYG